jgi:hypothetical protein
MWIIVGVIFGCLVVGLAVFLTFESRGDVLDQQWMKEVIVYPSMADRHYREFESMLGPIYHFYSRRAEDEAQIICYQLNVMVTYYGLERIPKDIPFVAVANEYTILDGCFLAEAINHVRRDEGAKLVRLKHWPSDDQDTYSLPVLLYGHAGNKLTPNGAKIVQKHLASGGPLVIYGSGKYDTRVFDKDDYFRFKSGFLRFARDSQVGILPVYVDIAFPLWIRLVNSFWPRFGETLIHHKSIDLMRNQHIKVTIGEFIPFDKIPASDLESTTTKSKEILTKYERLVFDLKDADTLRQNSTAVTFDKDGWGAELQKSTDY